MGRLSAVLLAWVYTTSLGATRSQEQIDFSIEGGPAEKTLYLFVSRAKLLCPINRENFRGIVTHPVVGRFTVESALRILTQDTGIVFSLTADYTRVNFERAPAPVTEASHSDHQSATDVSEQKVERPPEPQPTQPPEVLSRVTVTGSRLHDLDIPIGVSVVTLNDQDIRESGANSLGSFLLSQPQIFGGGATPDTRLGVDAMNNAGIGIAANIRGLGAPATLVLIDGQRLAPSGSQASYVDLTNIPLGAIDHLEMVLDSASAIYGSDAIGGVINVITRDGAGSPLTFAQWNSVTSGSWHSGTVYQTFTHHWDSGNFIAALGGTYQTALPTDERSFYTADLTYARGPNLQPPASSIPTVSTLDGKQSWALLSANIPDPTALDFKANAKNYLNPYQDAQIIAAQKPLNFYSRLLYNINDSWSVTVDGFATRRSASQVDGPTIVNVPIGPGSPYYVNLDGRNSPLLVQTNLMSLLGPRMTTAVTSVYDFSIQADANVGEGGTLSASVHDARERESQVVANAASIPALDTAIQSPSAHLNFNPYDQALDANPTTLEAIRGLLRYDSLSQVQNITLSLDGPVAPLPAGAVLAEAGLELRGQQFQMRSSENGLESSSPGDYQRHVLAAFAEVKFPLVNPDMGLSFARKIDLDMAVRREDYSDFGSVSTPRVGFRYAITDTLTLRAGWAKSFRAPDPGYLDQSVNTVVPIQLPDPYSPSRQSTALIENGNTAALKPERADEATFGAEWRFPLSAQTHLDILLDQFTIGYQGRIEATPFSDDLLSDPEYAYLVERNPTPAQLRSACASGQYISTAGTCLTSPVQAVINLRLQNVDQLETRGIDFNAVLSRQSSWGKFSWRVNGTYLFQYSETPYPGAQSMHLLNTDHNPIDLRFRSLWEWSYRQWDLSIAMNYTNHYRDTDTYPNQPIASLATFDSLLRYSIGERDAPGGMEITAGVQNITDRSPPYVLNTLGGVGYDQENADPYLRTWMVSILKRW